MSDRLAVALELARESAEARKARVRSERTRYRPVARAGYVFELDGRIKVGISRHPDKRAHEISYAAGAWVRVRQVIWFPDKASALQWETAAHQELAHAHLLGEWFEAAAAEAWLQQQPIGPGRTPQDWMLPVIPAWRIASRLAHARDWTHNHAPQEGTKVVA